MSSSIDLRKPHRPIHVGVILMGGCTEILDVAPVDMLAGMSKDSVGQLPDDFISPAAKAQAIDFKFHWVSETGKENTSTLTSGINLTPTDSFATCPPLDIVLIGATLYSYEFKETELAFIRESYDDCAAFLTICGGMIGPLRAGVLHGKTATAPRMMVDLLRKQAPGTTWVEKRWAHDGKLWTSGALLNGLDLMAAFCAEFWGGEGSLLEVLMKIGSWPVRDVDYKDEPASGITLTTEVDAL